jgi:thiol-disulfide isomerase/thioredoxin
MKAVIVFILIFKAQFSFGQFKFKIIGYNSSTILQNIISIQYKTPSNINYKAYKKDSSLIKNGYFNFLIDSQEPVLDLQITIGTRTHYMLIDSGTTNISILKSSNSIKKYHLNFSPSRSNDLYIRMNELEANERKIYKEPHSKNIKMPLNFERTNRSLELIEITKYPKEYYSLIRLYDISFHLNSLRFNEIHTAFKKLSPINQTLPLGVILNQRILNAFSLLPDKDLPFFKFTSFDGSSITNLNFLNGKVIFFFYATWCGPCKKIIPELKLFNEKHKNKIKLVLINLDDNKEDWKKLISKYQITELVNLTDNFPMLVSSNAANLLIDAVPQFLIAKDNKIVFKGFMSDFEKNEILTNLFKN